ncbi:calmodulin-A-like isoform X2 [Lineus longissimus]|uniref:calmodulin-A-like isoform X2 n=1 Tax=Lineus longissimus TaxID=88925 RepID=UPI00315D8779
MEQFQEDAEMGEERIAEYSQVFDMFDKDCDGAISAHELGGVMRTLGQHVTLTELKQMANSKDEQGKSVIFFPEFVTMMTQRNQMITYNDDDLKNVFGAFDLDNDGFISAGELQQVMMMLNEPLSKTEVIQMIKEADRDGDGKVCYEEFYFLMMEKKRQYSD